MSLHHDPVSGFTSHEPDHHALTRVRKAESEIVAHVWGIHWDAIDAESQASEVRGLRRCPSCSKPDAVILVDVVTCEITPKGARATIYAVVLRHPRS